MSPSHKDGNSESMCMGENDVYLSQTVFQRMAPTAQDYIQAKVETRS